MSSPLLDHCPPTLPAAAYTDADWYAREVAAIWRREWVHVGRLSDLPLGTIRPVTVAGAGVILCRSGDGALSVFHNSCRHRGAEICAVEAPLGKLVTCPYHAWAYAARDGRLVSTAFATPTADFDRSEHGLVPVAHHVWAGSIFVSLAADPPVFAPDLGLGALDNWPMERLVTGHRLVKDLACNWKVFWENYNECLHCPGIHPELSDLVPIYREGIMSEAERPGGAVHGNRSTLKDGAETWSLDGRTCGPAFEGLTEAQRATAANFVTVYPTAFFVAHVDYARVVTITPTGPESMRLTAEWLFTPETMGQQGFDPAKVAAFATIVLEQDGAAAEMNQRGMRSPAYQHGRLMPQEFDLHHFHHWVMTRLEQPVAQTGQSGAQGDLS